VCPRSYYCAPEHERLASAAAAAALAALTQNTTAACAAVMAEPEAEVLLAYPLVVGCASVSAVKQETEAVLQVCAMCITDCLLPVRSHVVAGGRLRQHRRCQAGDRGGAAGAQRTRRRLVCRSRCRMVLPRMLDCPWLLGASRAWPLM